MTDNKKTVIAWALYDWANSAFSTTIMAGFFPVFYKQYWAADLDASTSTFQLGMSNALASLVIVLTAPILGAIADRGMYRKAMLALFALVGVTASAGLYWVGYGDWAGAFMLYCAATIGFMGANVFYDALLVSVSSSENRDLTSAFGYALGYLGGGLLFSINVAMTLSPASFGLVDASEAVKYSFLSVALWWALFSLPLFFYVPEGNVGRKPALMVAIRAGWLQLLSTFRKIRLIRNVVVFLAAYWLYIDGVDTIVRMAVDYGLSIGLEQNHLIIALLITQFVGFPAAIGFGYIGQYLGTKLGLYIGIVVYVCVILWAYFLDATWEFYVMAAVIGLVQGGVQSLSRSFYLDIIPKNQAAEYFGFYNMMGKSAALIGPLMVGGVVFITNDHRLGILSIILLFAAGAYLLTKVRHQPVMD
ncbi:MAG: MFS transporter [Gammaproteobacteria bacterium]|nr:MFS transporter [Gammaproteobacteria bacterium]